MAAAYTLYRNTYDGDLSYIESLVASLPSINSVEDTDMGETYDWSRTGYNFLGWNTARNGSGTMYQAGASAPGGTYYAQWQEAVVIPDVTITYNNSTITTMSASGTEILETNGKMMADDITIEYTKPTPSLQAKTGISPSTSSQTITPDSGYDGLSSVQINAMTTMTLPTSTSSSSLGSQKAAIMPTTTTKYLNIPIGYNSTRSYYKLNAMTSGSATTPATTITANPSISVSNSGLITATASATQSVTPTVSAGYVDSGTAGTITVSGSNTSQLTTQAATTYTPTTTDQTIASGKYLTGAQTILGDQNLTAGNIKKDVSIFSVTGTYEGSGGGTTSVTLSGQGNAYYCGSDGTIQTVALTGGVNPSTITCLSGSMIIVLSDAMAVEPGYPINATLIDNVYLGSRAAYKAVFVMQAD